MIEGHAVAYHSPKCQFSGFNFIYSRTLSKEFSLNRIWSWKRDCHWKDLKPFWLHQRFNVDLYWLMITETEFFTGLENWLMFFWLRVMPWHDPSIIWWFVDWRRVSQKDTLSFLDRCSFLLLLQKKWTKEKEAGKDNLTSLSPIAQSHFPLQKTGCGSHLFRFTLAQSKHLSCW